MVFCVGLVIVLSRVTTRETSDGRVLDKNKDHELANEHDEAVRKSRVMDSVHHETVRASQKESLPPGEHLKRANSLKRKSLADESVKRKSLVDGDFSLGADGSLVSTKQHLRSTHKSTRSHGFKDPVAAEKFIHEDEAIVLLDADAQAVDDAGVQIEVEHPRFVLVYRTRPWLSRIIHGLRIPWMLQQVTDHPRFVYSLDAPMNHWIIHGLCISWMLQQDNRFPPGRLRRGRWRCGTTRVAKIGRRSW